MYKLLATIFWFYRQYYIQNPFDVLGDGITLTIDSSSFLLTPELLNFITDPIMFVITYNVVGLYYQSGTCPTVGSILYMVFYVIHMIGIYLVLSLYPTIWLMVLVVIFYLVIHILILRFRNRMSYF